jgi:hypothetical protein
MDEQKKEITTIDRIKDIQIDLTHMKWRLDAIYALIYKIEKDGLKVKK